MTHKHDLVAWITVGSTAIHVAVYRFTGTGYEPRSVHTLPDWPATAAYLAHWPLARLHVNYVGER